MPRVKPTAKPGRRKFHKDEQVRAVEAGYLEDPEHGPTYWRTNDLLDASHHAVVNCPGSFMPADTPADEVVHWLPEIAVVTHESEFIPASTPIPVENQVVCVHVVGNLSRGWIRQGQILDINDPVVQQQPSCFVRYAPLTPEDVA